MLSYKLIERKDMRKDAEADAKLYYPQLVHNGRVSFDTFCEEIAEQTSLTRGDIKNCMDRIVYNIAHHLKEGRSVDCGDLGTFWIALRSVGASTKKDYDVSEMMRKANVSFRPGKELRGIQSSLQYQRVEDGEPMEPEDDEEETGGNDDGPVVQ